MAHNKVYGFCESGCKVEVDPAGKVKPVSEGGTGATDAEQARKNIGAASEAHKHSADDIGGGTIPIANGGTGGSTAREAEYNICNGVGETTNAIADNTLIISKRTDASATNGAFTAKRASLLWTYIVEKIRSTFGFSSSNVLPIANGGTGATTAAGTRNALGLGNTTGPVPVANGGTGATDAATACNNLGALRITKWANGYTAFTDANELVLGLNVSGTDANVMRLNKAYTAFSKPVNINSGGTGATTAAGACENIGAVKKSGDTMTGSLTIHKAIGWSDLKIIRDNGADGATHQTEYTIDADNGVAQIKYRLNGTVVNALYLGKDQTSLGKPLSVGSGGTGATTAAAALKNLGLEIQTGTVNDVNSTGVTVTFKTEFSGVPVVVATGGSEQSSVQVKNVTKTGFTIESPMPNNDGCQWIAIYKA